MAIWAYVGLPRHGKTYNAVKEQILTALRAGRRVVTNVPLVADEIAARGDLNGEIIALDNDELKRDPASSLAACTGGAVCVFDELWRHLPQGLRQKDVDSAWPTLFAEHGHQVDEQGRMTQIVLITQDLSQLAAWARVLVERTVVISKLNAVGSSNRFRSAVYSGAVTGTAPPVSKRISEEYSTYDPAIFACYVSRTKSDAAQGVKVDERALDGRGSLWRHPMFRYVLPAAAIAGVWGLWRVVSFFTAEPVDDGATMAAVSSPSPSATSPRRVPDGRVSGVLRGDSGGSSWVLLELGDTSRWVPWRFAGCEYGADRALRCTYEGRTYVFGYAGRAERATFAGPGIGQILGVSANAAGSSE